MARKTKRKKSKKQKRQELSTVVPPAMPAVQASEEPPQSLELPTDHKLSYVKTDIKRIVWLLATAIILQITIWYAFQLQ
ncbi:MAG TPA: hypothetical protein VNA68_01535 [Candidatus Dormibacteraeota bacterium]|nr:hypothetical protein [Candidatus Dormibacteraeota bacterium]